MYIPFAKLKLKPGLTAVALNHTYTITFPNPLHGVDFVLVALNDTFPFPRKVEISGKFGMPDTFGVAFWVARVVKISKQTDVFSIVLAS